MSRKRASLTDLINNLTFRVHYNRFKNIALNMFEWEGLPETLKPEYIERTLYTHGQALFFRDKLNGFMCLPCNPSVRVNIYGEPENYYAYGFNYNEPYDIENSVLIKNNLTKSATDDIITVYANKITEIERALDTNVKGQKTPYIIACDDKDILTVKNMYKQIDENCPVIFADKNLNLDSLNVFPTLAPFVCDKLADYRHDVTNELLTFLGVNNSNTDKRERLLADEVNSNNEFIEHNAEYMLQCRKDAVEAINKMFNQNITVKLREVAESGEVHDDTERTDGQ